MDISKHYFKNMAGMFQTSEQMTQQELKDGYVLSTFVNEGFNFTYPCNDGNDVHGHSVSLQKYNK